MKLPNGRWICQHRVTICCFVRAAGKENGSEREMNTFVHLQEEILQYFLRFPQYILFRWNVNCYGVLVKCDAEEMEDYTQRAIAQIQMNCESQNANADWYVVVGTPVERLSMLKECYDRVNHYGAYRFCIRKCMYFRKRH